MLRILMSDFSRSSCCFSSNMVSSMQALGPSGCSSGISLNMKRDEYKEATHENGVYTITPIYLFNFVAQIYEPYRRYSMTNVGKARSHTPWPLLSHLCAVENSSDDVHKDCDNYYTKITFRAAGLNIHVHVDTFPFNQAHSWGRFTPVLALYDPFGVDVPLNFDITHSINQSIKLIRVQCLPGGRSCTGGSTPVISDRRFSSGVRIGSGYSYCTTLATLLEYTHLAPTTL